MNDDILLEIKDLVNKYKYYDDEDVVLYQENEPCGPNTSIQFAIDEDSMKLRFLDYNKHTGWSITKEFKLVPEK